MATPYVTPQEIAAIVGEAELAAAARDPDDPNRWHEATVQEAIDAASEQLDARLRNAYTLPLEDVPSFLSRAVARIVHDELVDSGTGTELIERRAKAAWKTVDMIASGELRIGEGDDDADGKENPRTRQGKAIIAAPPRRYRRTDLSGVI